MFITWLDVTRTMFILITWMRRIFSLKTKGRNFSKHIFTICVKISFIALLFLKSAWRFWHFHYPRPRLEPFMYWKLYNNNILLKKMMMQWVVRMETKSFVMMICFPLIVKIHYRNDSNSIYGTNDNDYDIITVIKNATNI